jgi:hypothetical protein
MATTTNFGWSTPDDSSAVKDGASAIRSLGTAIDTSLLDLKGGTTGQVLSKATNTDMDFSWTTSSSGGMTLLASSINTSGTNTITFNNINQTYVDLYIYINGLQNLTTNMSVTMSLNNSQTNTNYYSNQWLNSGGTLSAGNTGVGLPLLTVGGNILNPSGRNAFTSVIKVYRYASTSSQSTQFYVESRANTIAHINNGAFSANGSDTPSNTAITRIDFVTTQTLTAGNFFLYGVK